MAVSTLLKECAVKPLQVGEMFDAVEFLSVILDKLYVETTMIDTDLNNVLAKSLRIQTKVTNETSAGHTTTTDQDSMFKNYTQFM